MRIRSAILLLCLSLGLGCTTRQDQLLLSSQARKPSTTTGYVLVHAEGLKAQRIRCQVKSEKTDDPIYLTDDPDWLDVSLATLQKIDKGCAKRILEKKP